jgi:rhomboid protease GluP
MQSQKKGILCPNCGKLISSDEPVCPYCHHRHPGASWKARLRKSGFGPSSQVVNIIIYVNVGMYILSLLLSTRGIGMGWNPLTMLSPDSRSLILLGATGVELIDQYRRWWTLISANYLHGGLLHIFFNMIAFRQLAPFVTREFGSFRFIIIYSIGGVIGFWVSCLAGVPITIGASASVCALIGAILYYSKSRGGTYGKALYRQVSGWIISIFLFGIIVPGINNWGHGAGIVGGVLLGFLMGYNEKRPEMFFHKLLAYAMVIVTAFILGGAIIGAVIYRIGR